MCIPAPPHFASPPSLQKCVARSPPLRQENQPNMTGRVEAISKQLHTCLNPTCQRKYPEEGTKQDANGDYGTPRLRGGEHESDALFGSRHGTVVRLVFGRRNIHVRVCLLLENSAGASECSCGVLHWMLRVAFSSRRTVAVVPLCMRRFNRVLLLPYEGPCLIVQVPKGLNNEVRP